ncbi:holin [Gordonia phage Morgana]|uniref:Holin n=1 Tax=Gordonia phage Morgana TaxID=3137292 RepID=A0AAX4RAP0_9CAUD
MTMPNLLIALLRERVAPLTRETLYGFVALFVMAFGAKAQLDASLQDAIITVIVASVTFALAMVNSVSNRVAALYALVAAISGLGVILAPVTGTGWIGWVGTGFAVLGQAVALLRTPTAQ